MTETLSLAEYLGVSPMEVGSGNDRGEYFEVVRGWVLDRMGNDGLEHLKALVGMDVALLLDEAGENEWYPTAYSARLYEALFELIGRDQHMLAGFSKYYVWQRMKWLQRAFAAFMHPYKLAMRSGNMWAHFHDQGYVKVEIVDEKHARLSIHDWWASPVNCLVNTYFFTELVSFARAKDVKCKELDCVHRGDEFCRWDITWS